MGKGEKEKALFYIGNAATMLFLSGVVLTVITELFLEPLLVGFGSPQNVLPYAKTYTGITAIGFPFLILSAGGGHLIRADGSPSMAMISNLAVAVINTVLDALFVFGFNMGMQGAALATVIGQFVAAAIIVWYLCRFKPVCLLYLLIIACTVIKADNRLHSLRQTDTDRKKYHTDLCNDTCTGKWYGFSIH